eukprot:m.34884 g.34884  ORF g.34884 m.34884 type:complete len:356 (-) comp11213_c0_seq2:68-1135(-)
MSLTRCLGGCMLTEEQQEVRRASSEIDSRLRDMNKQALREVKLLFLGAGESGKSTLIKQLKIIHGGGFSPTERALSVHVVHENIFAGMRGLLVAVKDLSLAPDAGNVEDLLQQLDNAFWTTMHPPVALLKKLWADSSVQRAYRLRAQYQIADSTAYFLDALDRVTKDDYLPTDQDILRSRQQTTAIVEYLFELKSVRFRTIDIGGQRSQRSKWIHSFENVQSLIFVIAISEYDQTLFESRTTNRLREAVSLCRAMAQSPWFKALPLIIFFNKLDLFLEKLPMSDIKRHFPEFEGDGSRVEEVQSFIQQQFRDLPQSPNNLYHHFTCATDTSTMRFVFEAVESIFVTERLKEFHLE